MKRLKPQYFFSLVTLVFAGFLSVTGSLYASEEATVSEETVREVLETVKTSADINKEIKNVGVPLATCPGCAPKGPDQVTVLDAAEVDIGNPYYKKSNEPYVIYLKRTSKSPAKIDLKLKNGYEYCAKMYAGTFYGNIVMGCVIYMTRYEDEEISLNLKKLPKLSEGQEEIIELRFTKPNLKNSKYELKVTSLTEATHKEDIGKKFLGGGFNVSFEVEK